MRRRAKIVATIGPATRSPEMLRKMMEAGMDVARLNFSHGELEDHRETIRTLRKISEELERPVAILQDLQGVKIRTGALQEGKPVELETGDRFTITTKPVMGDKKRVSTGYQALPYDVKPGDRVLLSDGLIELEVLSTTEEEIETEVITGGTLAENQGINAPGANLSAPSLTDKDIEDVRFGIKNEVDYIALSFVRRVEDIIVLKSRLDEARADIPVIAKLEKPRAIDNLESILDACDGVMVARGDLGVEMPPEQVPILQKRIIQAANKKGKPVITATQMLESMIKNPRPTRAEASDVANAVFDGTDAVMLSAETATGSYPVESVRMMDKIITAAESTISEIKTRQHSGLHLSFPDAICEAAYYASQSIRTRAICAFTQTGSTASTIAKYRPRTAILGLSPDKRIMRRMCLFWGVQPVQMRTIANVDELINMLERTLLERGFLVKGDNLIILTGAPIIEKGHTSLMKLHRVQGSRSTQMKMI
ncbi:MAG TPA: pyruvate kinase [Acidobacteriota bacterium]|nr:pyruvate kinase [Acidobacteriota bacterium]